jgi:bis(5'-nucleosyl)-tetraphosphatase (symmetrical)
MANYAIGDIQGCYDSLRSLLEIIHFDKDNDTLWIAGDLVNRGPKSLETLRYLKSLGDACHVVLGNHDLHMISVAYSRAPRKPKDTFFDVLDAYDAAELIDWLRKQNLVQRIEVNNKVFLLSHAGIPPIWSAQQALNFSSEVEKVISGNNAIDFLYAMYGNEPNTWSDDLSGNDRLRVITNYFTRMRFCNAQGQLELTSKNPPLEAPEGFKPWYEIVNPYLRDEKLIFGHWAAAEGKTGKTNIFALDTGCVWGNRLTALRLEDEQEFSVEAVE